MCGIVAIVGGDPSLGRLRGRLALEAIAHRGPDDEGVWSDGTAWLGHKRLAIIDLTVGGHQPMIHAPSGLVITYNGEIYNYIELRRELQALGHVFRTDSDTEVLLAAYLAWGPDCLFRLNGIWAFLIWDPRNQSAFFARDRLGVKPLYYSADGRRLAVASEPKALLALDPSLRKVDEAALYGFLAEGNLYTDDRSFYAGIRVLKPGQYGIYSPADAELSVRTYWAPPAEEDTTVTYASAAARFGDLFQDAVRLRMRSDVPVGFTVSGGLDSSAILQAAVSVSAPGKERLRAFTSVYPTAPGDRVLDERQWARLVAERVGRVGLEEVEASDDDWLAVLSRVVWHMDGPGYSPAVFPLWKIMARARATGVPVLLEGQGADELLGGYPQYAALGMKEEARRLRLLAFARDFRDFSSTFTSRMLALWLARETFPFLIGLNRRRVGSLRVLDPDFARRVAHEPEPREVTSINGRLKADLTRSILPGLLHYGDAISMAHAVETRLPFLDYRLVEMVCSLPGDYKVGRGKSKRILRDHLRSVGLPEIADRRDKKGYPTPADDWLRADGGAIPRSLLLAPDSAIRTYCLPSRLQQLISYHAQGRRGAGNHLYRLLTTEIWLKSCISAGFGSALPSRPDPDLSEVPQ